MFFSLFSILLSSLFPSLPLSSFFFFFSFFFVDFAFQLGFPSSSAGKESAFNAGVLGSIPGLGRCPGEGNNYLLQYSGLENSMDCTRSMGHNVVSVLLKNWITFYIYILKNLIRWLSFILYIQNK